MNTIDFERVKDALRELSDVELQRRLWLSDGSGGSDVSSFAEAIERLFTDSGLSEAVRCGSTTLTEEWKTSLCTLEGALWKVDGEHGPKRTIEDSAMERVRRLASELLRSLE